MSSVPAGAGASGRLVLSATVWRRSRLAQSLGFKGEEQLVEWCILIGNDYTKHFPKSSFTGYSTTKPPTTLGTSDSYTSNGQNEYSSLETMRKFIISRKPSYRLASTNDELQLSIAYSRAVYNLLDLKPYEMSGNLRNGAGKSEADDENSDGYLLSSMEKNSLSAWRRATRRTSQRPDSVGLHVINFLKTHIATSTSNMHANEKKLFAGITSAHLDAFVLMLKNINQTISRIHDADVESVLNKLTKNLANTDFFAEGPKRSYPNGRQQPSLPSSTVIKDNTGAYLCPKWENVRAARTYQLLCSRFFEKRGKEEMVSDVSTYSCFTR